MTISHAPANLVGLWAWAIGTASAGLISGASWLVGQAPGIADHAPAGIVVSVALAVIGLLTQVAHGFFADRRAKHIADARFTAQALELQAFKIRQGFADQERDRIAKDLDRAKADAEKVAKDLALSRDRKHEDVRALNRVLVTLQYGYGELIRAADANAPALKAILDRLQIDMPVIESIGLSADDIAIATGPLPGQDDHDHGTAK